MKPVGCPVVLSVALPGRIHFALSATRQTGITPLDPTEVVLEVTCEFRREPALAPSIRRTSIGRVLAAEHLQCRSSRAAASHVRTSRPQLSRGRIGHARGASPQIGRRLGSYDIGHRHNRIQGRRTDVVLVVPGSTSFRPATDRRRWVETQSVGSGRAVASNMAVVVDGIIKARILYSCSWSMQR